MRSAGLAARLGSPDVPVPARTGIDPAARRTGDPLRRLPSVRRRRRVDRYPLPPRRRSAARRRPPLALNPPPRADGDPGGHARRPEPDARSPGTRPFAPPSFNPVNGSMVGVAKPIYINFARPIANRQMAAGTPCTSRRSRRCPASSTGSATPSCAGARMDFWPANTIVNIDAGGTKSSFRTGESLVATVDDTTHQMTIMRNGKVEKTFPVSMGKTGTTPRTAPTTCWRSSRHRDGLLDLRGAGQRRREGYKLKVQNAVRIDNSGNFVHSAPWSVADQGKRNVSHGCINLSPANAQWFYDNFGSGDPVVIKNSVGGSTTSPTARRTGRCSRPSSTQNAPHPTGCGGFRSRALSSRCAPAARAPGTARRPRSTSNAS